MPNGVHKLNQFEAATRVMESDLIRVLADESSGSEADQDTDASSGTLPEIEIVVAEAVLEQAIQSEPAAPLALSAATVAPAPRPNASGEPRPRGSRVFIVAGIVAAIVLACDASLFVLHQRRVARPVAAAAAPEPLPRYMVLPLGTPAAPVEEAKTEAPAPTPAPATTSVVAAALPQPTEPLGHARHSHHRHGSH